VDYTAAQIVLSIYST